MQIERPSFQTIPLAEGLSWRAGGGWIYQEKLDGCWDVVEVGQSTLVGERMRDGSFHAFDCVCVQGDDIRREPLTTRLDVLRQFFSPTILPVQTGSGGEFLEHVLARGGEGIVAKHGQSYFGVNWLRCKRPRTFDCLVTEKHPSKMSVHLVETGVDRGWCAALYGTFERLQVGQIVEVEAYGLTAAGKFREPRLKRCRPDKYEPVQSH